MDARKQAVRTSVRLAAAMAMAIGLSAQIGCHQASKAPPPARWTPGRVYSSPASTTSRGLIDRRGLIHSHSVYSHDACDNKPVVDGQRDPVCFDDFRRGLCESKNDFVMLTDHRASFADTPYPDALLYRPERGDKLIEREGRPVASWAACPDGSKALILAGSESGTMPVGLEAHVSKELQDEAYGDHTPAGIAALKANGAVVLVAHTEGWTKDQLTALPLDGFEMYNLHANTLVGAGGVLEILVHLSEKDLALMHPDLIALAIISEDPRYLNTWSQVLAAGVKRVTTMGCDCHRNAFQVKLDDGERVDSYRRMMSMFSNHLLVRPDASGGFDDRALKDALRSGRLYGVFEVFGVPVGFDYRAEVGSAPHEMGEEIALLDHPTLFVARPQMRDLDPAVPAPELTLRILRATDRAWEVVAEAAGGDLRFSPAVAGAYRAEVRITPRHLAPYLGAYKDTYTKRDFVWIYANPIYVR